jgi:hypothetical protein
VATAEEAQPAPYSEALCQFGFPFQTNFFLIEQTFATLREVPYFHFLDQMSEESAKA